MLAHSKINLKKQYITKTMEDTELVANHQDSVDVCEIKPITKSKFEEYDKNKSL